jgi:hypothetical protein
MSTGPQYPSQSYRARLGPPLCRIQAALGLRPRSFFLITGCPRSGTSALHSWLKLERQTACIYEPRNLIAAHQYMNQVDRLSILNLHRSWNIAGIKEAVYYYYARYLRIWRRVLIDKEPLEPIAFPDRDYVRFIQHVREVFPEAGLLFMIRVPAETIWSIVNRQWGESLTSGELVDVSLEEAIAIWNDAADAVLEFRDDPNAYFCFFASLVAEPERESAAIWRFLSINSRSVFQPGSTKQVGFSESELEQIRRETAGRWDALAQLKRD